MVTKKVFETYDKNKADELLAAKQNVLTAGTGITITNDVISATGGGGSGGMAWTEIQADQLSTAFSGDYPVYIALHDIIVEWTSIGNTKSQKYIPKGTQFSTIFFEGVASTSPDQMTLGTVNLDIYTVFNNDSMPTAYYMQMDGPSTDDDPITGSVWSLQQTWSQFRVFVANN